MPNAIQQIRVKSLPITLAQFLKWCGATLTGGQAKELIQAGRVQLNGELCLQPGRKLQPGDLIELQGSRWQLVLPE